MAAYNYAKNNPIHAFSVYPYTMEKGECREAEITKSVDARKKF